MAALLFLAVRVGTRRRYASRRRIGYGCQVLGSSADIASVWVERGYRKQTNLLLVYDVQEGIRVRIGGTRECIATH
jgi:hypothetical protein